MIQEENILDILQEFAQLAEENGLEIYGSAYNPSFVTFITMAKNRALRAFTYRKKGQLVGYVLFIVSPKLQQKQIICGDCATIFVQKKYRGLGALQLVKHSEQILRADGVHQIQYHATNKYTNFFNRLGYTQTDITFKKDI